MITIDKIEKIIKHYIKSSVRFQRIFLLRQHLLPYLKGVKVGLLPDANEIKQILKPQHRKHASFVTPYFKKQHRYCVETLTPNRRHNKSKLTLQDEF